MEHFDINDNELDQLFSDGLDGMEMTPPPEIWTGLEAGLGGAGGTGGAAGGGAAGSGGFLSGLKGAFWVKVLIGGAAVVGTGTAVYIATSDGADDQTPIADVETITPEQAASISTFELNEEITTSPSQEDIADNTANYTDQNDVTDNTPSEPVNDASPNTVPPTKQSNTIPADATADNTSSDPTELADSPTDPETQSNTPAGDNIDASNLPIADPGTPGDFAREPDDAQNDPGSQADPTSGDVRDATSVDVTTDSPNELSTGNTTSDDGNTDINDVNSSNASDADANSNDPRQHTPDSNDPNSTKGTQDNMNDPQFVPETGDTLDAVSGNPRDGGSANPGTTDPNDSGNTASNPNEIDPNVTNTGSGNSQDPEKNKTLTPREHRKENRKNNKATTQPGANDPTATNASVPEGKPEGEILKPWERFYLSASISPEISMRQITDVHSDPDPFESADWLKENEESELTWSPNFRLGFDINQKLAIQTGVSFYKWERSLDGVEQAWIVSDDEEEEEEEEADPSGNMAYHTSSGYVDYFGQHYEIDDAEEDDELLYFLESNENISYWYIPLEARYTFVDKKLKLYGSGGLSMHFLRSSELNISLRNEDNTEFTIKDGIAGLKENFFGYQLGFGAQYAITDRWNLYFEPTMRGTFGSPNDDNIVEFKPYTFGLQTGLMFHF